MKLKNKKVVVTGGGSGYGKGIAAALAAAGAKVWITGRDGAKLARAAKSVGATAMVADVTSGEDWDRVFKTVGVVDILVNNAGAGVKIADVAEQSDAEIAESVSVNLTGAIMGCARAAKLMKARGKGGAIVNVSSVCAQHAWPGWSVYTAAKAGLLKFSHGLHVELRPFGVKVTCVIPSWGQTLFNRTVGIVGASEDKKLAKKCIAPEELGAIVRGILEQPDHLTVPEVTVQPMVQDIVPM